MEGPTPAMESPRILRAAKSWGEQVTHNSSWVGLHGVGFILKIHGVGSVYTWTRHIITVCALEKLT